MTLRQRNHIDVVLMLAVLTLMLLSLGIVYSASAAYAEWKWGESERMLGLHALKVAIGIAGLFFCMRIDYHRLQKLTKPVVVLAVVLLVITLVTGVVAKGASRWLRVSSFGFQPSEFAKYALLFHICTLISVKGELIRDWKRGFVPMMVWIGLVTGLIMLQPNFSMGAMIFLLSMLMVFLGRAKLSHLALTVGAILPVIMGYMLIAEYRRERLWAFFVRLFGGGGADDRSDAFYQVFQGIVGFGHGGIFGVGVGESVQRNFFLPESYGDFVFSIIGEEYGFIGTIFFLLIFLLILVRGFRIAKFALDPFGRYLAIAITSTVAVYALVNAGVTLGVFPTTGLPMPFVSYGGSSMVFSACAVGVLLNISSQTDLHPRIQQVPVVGMVNADGAGVGKVY